MFTFETTNPKEARSFRMAQFNGRTATVRSGGSTVTGHVLSVLECRSNPRAICWTITIVPAEPRIRDSISAPTPRVHAFMDDFS
jgi:hypothetical protein